MRVPFVDLKAQYDNIREEIDIAIAEVIRETAFISGKYVRRFEEEFGNAYGVKHVISCANGTDSLFIIMKMLGIGPGDEVITPANSWISSAETISQTGATPIFCDVHPVYYSIDERLLEDLISSRTKAILAVHLHGQMCQIDTIRDLCERKGIYLIEDCAQAHFSDLCGKRAGTWGIAGSFSFYPGKNLGAYGDAGCIITNDDNLAARCRMYANHGSLIKHQHQIEGINSRMDGLQAAILCAKLPYIGEWTEKRRTLAETYTRLLKDMPGLIVPTVRPDSKHTFHLYVIRHNRRDALKGHFERDGIECSIHYPSPLPFLPCYQDRKFRSVDFPVSAQLQQEILSLPIFPEMTTDQILSVVNSLEKFGDG